MHACVSVFRLGMRMLCILAVFAFDRPACFGVVRELSNSMRAKPPAGRSIRMLEWCCFITYFAAVLLAVLVFQSTMCVKFCPQIYRVNRLLRPHLNTGIVYTKYQTQGTEPGLNSNPGSNPSYEIGPRCFGPGLYSIHIRILLLLKSANIQIDVKHSPK